MAHFRSIQYVFLYLYNIFAYATKSAENVILFQQYLFQLLRGLIVLAILESYMAGIDVFNLATPDKE